MPNERRYSFTADTVLCRNDVKGKWLLDTILPSYIHTVLYPCLGESEDFSKPKIVFQEIVQESQFFYDMDGRFICNDTCRIIVGKELSFLLGVLNSKLFFYAIKHFYGGGVLGEHGIRMKHTFFQNFPCIQYNSTIDKLVKELTEKKNAKVENQIGNKIYNLYGLTPQEIQMVEE